MSTDPEAGTTGYAPEAAEFDREINVRGIVWSGVALVAITAVSMVIVWWLLRGIASYDRRHDVPLSPIEASNPQPPPPEPRLEMAPSENLRQLHEEEDLVLHHAGWVDQGQGTVRVPIDVAIDVIAERGVAPQAADTAPAPPVQ